MKTNIRYLFKLFVGVAVWGVTLFFSSCRDDAPELLNPQEYDINNNESLFLAFWHGMNNSYVYWDVDPTDWDAMYDQYLPVFQDLDEKMEQIQMADNVSEEEAEAMSEVSLNSPFSSGRSPCFTRTAWSISSNTSG